MAKKSWLKIIGGLKRLIKENGPLWPNSTKLSGYAEKGPYNCGMCEYAKGMKQGNIFRDEQNRGRCLHPVVIADKETEKDKNLLPIINLERGCCEWVEEYEKEEE